MTISPLLARVSITFSRLQSLRNPTPPHLLDRTAEKTINSFSLPWKLSTVAISRPSAIRDKAWCQPSTSPGFLQPDYVAWVQGLIPKPLTPDSQLTWFKSLSLDLQLYICLGSSPNPSSRFVPNFSKSLNPEPSSHPFSCPLCSGHCHPEICQ